MTIDARAVQGGWYVNVTVPDAARSYDLSITTATIMGTREYPLASGYFDTYITAPPGGGGLAIEALELRDVTDMANPVVVERIVNVGTWPPAGTATINSFGAPAVSAEAGPNELGISFQQPEKQLLDNGTEIDTEFPPQLYQMGVQLAQGLGDNPIIRGTITVDDASRDLLYDATVDPEIGSIVGDVQADPQGAALNRITLRSNDGGMILEDTGPPNLAAILLGKNLYVTNARNPAELVEYSTRTGGADSVTFTRAAEQGTIYVGLFAQAGAISLRRFNPSGLSNDFGTAHTSTADGVSDIRALFQYDERLWGVAASGDNLQFYRTGQGELGPFTAFGASVGIGLTSPLVLSAAANGATVIVMVRTGSTEFAALFTIGTNGVTYRHRRTRNAPGDTSPIAFHSGEFYTLQNGSLWRLDLNGANTVITGNVRRQNFGADPDGIDRVRSMVSTGGVMIAVTPEGDGYVVSPTLNSVSAAPGTLPQEGIIDATSYTGTVIRPAQTLRQGIEDGDLLMIQLADAGTVTGGDPAEGTYATVTPPETVDMLEADAAYRVRVRADSGLLDWGPYGQDFAIPRNAMAPSPRVPSLNVGGGRVAVMWEEPDEGASAEVDWRDEPTDSMGNVKGFEALVTNHFGTEFETRDLSTRPQMGAGGQQRALRQQAAHTHAELRIRTRNAQGAATGATERVRLDRTPLDVVLPRGYYTQANIPKGDGALWAVDQAWRISTAGTGRVTRSVPTPVSEELGQIVRYGPWEERGYPKDALVSRRLEDTLRSGDDQGTRTIFYTQRFLSMEAHDIPIRPEGAGGANVWLPWEHEFSLGAIQLSAPRMTSDGAIDPALSQYRMNYARPSPATTRADAPDENGEYRFGFAEFAEGAIIAYEPLAKAWLPVRDTATILSLFLIDGDGNDQREWHRATLGQPNLIMTAAWPDGRWARYRVRRGYFSLNDERCQIIMTPTRYFDNSITDDLPDAMTLHWNKPGPTIS